MSDEERYNDGEAELDADGLQADGLQHGEDFTYGRNEAGELVIGGIPVGDRLPETDEEAEATPEQVKDWKERALKAEGQEQSVQDRLNEIAPYLSLHNSEEFKEWLNEQAEMGSPVSFDPVGQPATEVDVAGYQKRMGQPGSASVLEALHRFAETADPATRQRLDSNAREFNKTFDKIAKELGRTDGPSVQDLSRPPAPKHLEQILRGKEASKQAAQVERPGVSPAGDPSREQSRRNERTMVIEANRGNANAADAWADMLWADIKNKGKKTPPRSGF